MSERESEECTPPEGDRGNEMAKIERTRGMDFVSPEGDGDNDSADQDEQTCDVDADIARLEIKLREFPVWRRNPELCRRALRIVDRWRVLFREADLDTWRKIRKRVAKELNESEPCITYVMDYVARRQSEGPSREKVSIIDICSGFGICSMFLSELLPPEAVETIWLVDYNFPCGDQTTPPHVQRIFYDREWPIPLRFRKTNIKKKREIRQLRERVLDRSPGPILMLGIHLCKALSVHAIKLYQSCPKAEALVLKPCCLPGKDRLKDHQGEPIRWKFTNGYEFGPCDIYCKDVEGANDELDRSISEEKEDSGEGAPEKDAAESDDDVDTAFPVFHGGRHCTNALFSRWVSYLEKACQDDSSSRVHVDHISITTHHFQNKFIYCERSGV